MKTEDRHLCIVQSKTPPTVEVDTEGGAAYIRFGKGKVPRIEVQENEDALITVDLDKNGRVLGIEMVGVEEFTIRALLKKIPAMRELEFPAGEVRYLPAGRSFQSA